MNTNAKDISGQVFGRLTALYPLEERKGQGLVWHCVCDCGNEIDVTQKGLAAGSTRSCGCLHKSQFDLTGMKFGKLTVLKLDLDYHPGRRYWLCKCDCGNYKTVYQSSLISGATKSCGCLIRTRKQQEVEGKKFGKLTVLKYFNGTGKKKARCLCKCDCGGEVNVLYDSLRAGKTISCGCVKSKGEEIIAHILDELKIPHIRQKSFENLVSNKNRKLHFDFFLPQQNICIEFQGPQHYNKNTKWYSEEGVQRDNLKRQYCVDNNIKLIEILYDDLDLLDKDYILNKIKFDFRKNLT